MSSSEMPSSNSKRERPAPLPDTGSLPDSYGVTEAYLLPRDPLWMFIYWEITENSVNAIKKEHGTDVFSKSKSVIRIHDVSDVEFNGSNSHKFVDVPAVFEAKSWYVNVPEPGRCYLCELGLLTPDGKFIAICRTNTLKLPTGKVSDVTDEKWMTVQGDFEKLLALSGVEYVGRGSGEMARVLAQRWEMLRAVFSRSASWGLTSLPGGRGAKERGFWLVADCELILYGATEPDAKVTVAGRNIKLNPDGTFTMRFAFPDGKLDLPVEAYSNDGVDRRKITITATRATNNDENR